MGHALARIVIKTRYKFGQPQNSTGLGLLFGLLWVKIVLLLGRYGA